ncbi:adenylate kinase [Liberiplasma polymorphum]|uniref:adenylate kinase n=1 Tax=Liberiplasma polymorphum TaxID=3374570 RepID=UPI003774313E
MKILLMGPPGAGKGSQSAKLVEEFQLTNISTGEMFRESFRNNEPLGIEAMKYIDKGNLVADDITNEIVRKRLLREDAERCFLLDGYPRTVAQAEALDEMLNQMNSKLTAVINITVDKEAILERMVGRRVCKKCGLSYHLSFKPPKQDGVCDECGGELYQRTDDQLSSVKNRLDIYENKTKPIIEYYKNRGILKNVDGMQSFDEVYQDIKKALGEA